MSSSPSFNPFEIQLPDHTSESHPLVVVPVCLRTGVLYVTIAPGYRTTVLHQDKGVLEIRRDLAADVARLDELGINRLVTTMSAVDILDGGLGGLLTDLDGYGIDWSHIPFPSVREQDIGFQDYLKGEMDVIRRDVDAGRRVAVHLKAWSAELERRMAIMATMLEPDLSPVEARSMAMAAVRLGQCILPF